MWIHALVLIYWQLVVQMFQYLIMKMIDKQNWCHFKLNLKKRFPNPLFLHLLDARETVFQETVFVNYLQENGESASMQHLSNKMLIRKHQLQHSPAQSKRWLLDETLAWLSLSVTISRDNHAQKLTGSLRPNCFGHLSSSIIISKWTSK